MIKKKAKSKKAAKKSGKGKRSTKSKKELSPADVRKDIAEMVKSEAETMAQAVIDEGKKGQLTTVKYLFEMAEIYPPQTDQGQATAEEESLAETLLHRLNIPTEPVKLDDDDAEDESSAAEAAGKQAREEEDGGSAEAGEESKDPVVM